MQATVVKRKSSGTPQLYTLKVFLTDGPMTKAFAGKEISRTIQIRGDQTLQALHRAIFKAFDREEEHLHEFNFGKGPPACRAERGAGRYDREGPRYTLRSNMKDFMTDEVTAGDVAKTTLDALGLEVGRAFGYWFDFGDDWKFRVRKSRLAAPPVKGAKYPRVVERAGPNPEQYPDWDEE